jgi:hypothetical protein
VVKDERSTVLCSPINQDSLGSGKIPIFNQLLPTVPKSTHSLETNSKSKPSQTRRLTHKTQKHNIGPITDKIYLNKNETI